jgi:hypothetical protein
MRSLILAGVTAVALAVPAVASSAEVPPIQCDPASCTYKVDQARECVDGAIVAIRYALQGTPQPQECNL